MCIIKNIKKKNAMKAFVTSQLADCPLIWMFRNILINHTINKLLERALKSVYKNSGQNKL